MNPNDLASEPMLFCLIEFIGVTLINKIIKVSGVQFCNTSLCMVLCVYHPKTSLLPTPFIPLYPLLPPPDPFPLAITILLSEFTPLWKAVWRYLKKLNTELPYDTAVPPLVIHLKKPETLTQKNNAPLCSLQHYLQSPRY